MKELPYLIDKFLQDMNKRQISRLKHERISKIKLGMIECGWRLHAYGCVTCDSYAMK